ncbi:hypothetical protein BKA65DRAFT_517663 [Rhexocercosporidium sp. MPI-PUGE-AT-0058]|nr:hypothetical protein BKA65DRAFT_517663 [Rhexocercosporidium sp. MPI-PUGE-AT-0058]
MLGRWSHNLLPVLSSCILQFPFTRPWKSTNDPYSLISLNVDMGHDLCTVPISMALVAVVTPCAFHKITAARLSNQGPRVRLLSNK